MNGFILRLHTHYMIVIHAKKKKNIVCFENEIQYLPSCVLYVLPTSRRRIH